MTRGEGGTQAAVSALFPMFKSQKRGKNYVSHPIIKLSILLYYIATVDAFFLKEIYNFVQGILFKFLRLP